MKGLSILLVSILIVTGYSIGNAEEAVNVERVSEIDYVVSTVNMSRQVVEENRFAMAKVSHSLSRETAIMKDDVKELMVLPGQEYIQGTPWYIKSGSLLNQTMLKRTIESLRERQYVLSHKVKLLSEIERDPIIQRTQSIIYDIYHTSLFMDPLTAIDSEIGRLDHNGMILDISSDQDVYNIKHINHQYKEVTFTLNAEDSSSVKAGNLIESNDGLYSGYVTEAKISSLNGVKVVKVTGYLMDMNYSLQYGDLVSIRIVMNATLKNVIPKSVVLSDGDSKYVLVVREGEVNKHMIRVEESFDDFIVVTYGLASTDLIVNAGSKIVNVGDYVKVNN